MVQFLFFLHIVNAVDAAVDSRKCLASVDILQ